MILENVSEYKMSIEKNVIQLAGALVSCNLIGFRWSVIGREYSPQNRNIHLTCGVSCISMLRVLFYIYLLFPIQIYPTGRFNLNKESVCWNLIIQTDLGLSKEKCHIEWMYEEIKESLLLCWRKFRKTHLRGLDGCVRF